VPLPPQAVDMFQSRPVPLRAWFPGWTYKSLSLYFSRAAKQAGLANVTFHTLRHTFANHAVMAGVDLYTLAKILGHRDIQMVQRYAHLAPSHLKTAATIAASAIFADNMPPEVPQFAEKAA
jgi:integrase